MALGTSTPRVDDHRLLTEGGMYVADLPLEGALHAVFVRSPIAHARISEIDTDEAQALDGVVHIFTAADLDCGPFPPLARAPSEMVRPMLADGIVRFVGEPVALILVDDPYIAEDAAEMLWIDYDPLPLVTDIREAAADEMLLFPEAGTNTTQARGDEPLTDPCEGCEVTVTLDLVNQRVAPCPLEGRSAAAIWNDGKLTTWISTQSAHGARDRIAKSLDVDAGDVHVIVGDVGGAFGSKINIYPEDVLVAWAARHVNRPVRWLETRTEQMISMGHGRGQLMTATLGGTRDGRIEALQLDVLQDSGAYPALGSNLPMFTALMASGTYDIARIETRTRSVLTNTCPTEAYRGAGRPEATAMIERMMDRFAAEIDMDPAELRRRNLIPADAFPFTTATGAEYDTGDYATALEKALTAADYDELRAEQQARRTSGDPMLLGIGISSYVEITAGPRAGFEHAKVTMQPDGSMCAWTGSSPHGQGHSTSFAQVVADVTGGSVDSVDVRWGDTKEMPEGIGTFGSRTLQLGGAAVREATLRVLDVAKEDAARLLDAPSYDITYDKASRVFRSGAGAEVSLEAVAAESADGITINHKFEAASPTYPFGAHVVVVEVDSETGLVTIARVIACDDAGTIINPMLAEGQRHGGLAQGLAQALLETVVYDADGNPQTSNLADYGMISTMELPSYELVPMETPTPVNPLGAKGVGESGTIGATPALQNAVVDALSHLGVTHIDIPCTSQAVWNALRNSESTGV